MSAATPTRGPELKVVAPPASAIERLIDDYLASCRAKGLSAKTVKYSYGFPLRGVFLPWCAREGITEPAQLTNRLLERFTAELLERGGKEGPLSKHSVATYSSTVNHFLAWAHKEEEVGELRAPEPAKPKKLMEVLSREEIDQLEEAARNERDKLIVRVLADTGMRLGELVGLRLRDLVERRRSEHYLHITGKGQRDRLVPTTPAFYRRLQRFITHYRQRDAHSDRLFLALKRRPHRDEYEPLTGSGVNQLINTLAQEAGLAKRTYPHLLRHSFATWALAKGMGPFQLAQILGHSSLAMITSVYSHLTPQDAHAAYLKALLTEERDD